ncbi:MAG: hypothetical protein IKI11_10425 [Neisseriaceae bacterium]|nr:hypothetical protein [Neisseriaceae bacterium]
MMKTKIFNYFLLSVVVLFLSSCSRTKDVVWHEEVQLNNGEIIIVKQTVNIYLGRDMFFQKVTPKNWIKVEVDDKNISNPPPAWLHKEWLPLILDKNENNEWYIVVTFSHCENWNSDFFYRQYKVVNGEWKRTKFNSQLFGRQSNLEHHLNSTLREGVPKFLKLSDKSYDGFIYMKSILSYAEQRKQHISCKDSSLSEQEVREQEQWLPDDYVPISWYRKKGQSGEFFYYSDNWGDTIAKQWADKPVSVYDKPKKQTEKLDEQNKEQSK